MHFLSVTLFIYLFFTRVGYPLKFYNSILLLYDNNFHTCLNCAIAVIFLPGLWHTSEWNGLKEREKTVLLQVYSVLWLLMESELNTNLQSTSKKVAGFKWTKWLEKSNMRRFTERSIKNYKVKQNKVKFHVDVQWNENWVSWATRQRRNVTVQEYFSFHL